MAILCMLKICIECWLCLCHAIPCDCQCGCFQVTTQINMRFHYRFESVCITCTLSCTRLCACVHCILCKSVYIVLQLKMPWKAILFPMHFSIKSAPTQVSDALAISLRLRWAHTIHKLNKMPTIIKCFTLHSMRTVEKCYVQRALPQHGMYIQFVDRIGAPHARFVRIF